MKNSLEVLKNRYLFLVPASLSVTAIVLLVVSSTIGVDHFTFEGKEAGYLLAPNWTISFIIVFPLIGVLSLLILHRIEQTLRELGKNRMLFDTTTQHFLETPKSLSPLIKKWNEILRIAFWSWIVLTTLGFAASFTEWWDSSYIPLTKYENVQDLRAKSSTEPAVQKDQKLDRQPGDKLEIDWSIAGLAKSISKRANYLFSLAAFLLLQGTALSFLSFFLVLGVAFGALVICLSGQERFVALPDLNSTDDRKGFEIFQGLGTLMLLSSLCLFFVFYLTILQNVYLHKSDAANIYQMLLEPIRHGFENGSLKMLFSSELSADYSTSFARIGGGVVVLLVFVLIPGLLLSYLASRAKSRLIEIAKSPQGAEILGQDRAKVEESMKVMRMWPYSYFSLNMLLGAALLLAATLFLPHLAGYLYGLTLAAVLGLVIARIKDQFKGPGENSKPDAATTLNRA